MAEPAELPRWATAQTDPEADNTEPTEATKDDGWLNTDVPPAGYFNWWMNLVYQWCVYLDDIATEAFTWTALHTFNLLATFGAGIAVTGAVTATGEVEGASLQTAQTSVQRAQGWHSIPMCAFNVDAALANMVYNAVTDEWQASAGVPALTRLGCAQLPHLVTGDRIRDIKLTATPVDGTPSSCDLWLCRKETATGTISQLVLASVTTTATRATVTSADIAHVVADGYTYFLAIEMGDTADTGVFEAAGVRSDRIA